MSEPNPPAPKKYVRVNVRGKNASVWKRMRKGLVKQVQGLMAVITDPDRGCTLGDEARALTASAFDWARAKLDRPGLENAELEAKVGYLHAQATLIRSQARETNARAEAQEIKNAFEKLKLLLEAAKVMARMTGDDGDEMACFVRDVESFQEMLIDVVALADAGDIPQLPAPPGEAI